jgi:hypothetical protein
MKAARKIRQLQQPKSLLGYLRQFLTPGNSRELISEEFAFSALIVSL